MNQNHSIRMQVLCALFAAVTAVCSQITIPIQPVPGARLSAQVE